MAMSEDIQESDWKLFRSMAVERRERYLEKKNAEIDAILRDPHLTPTERFWAVEKRVKKEARILQDCLDDPKRSTLILKARLMRSHGMLESQDVEKFSDTFQKQTQPVL